MEQNNRRWIGLRNAIIASLLVVIAAILDYFLNLVMDIFPPIPIVTIIVLVVLIGLQAWIKSRSKHHDED